MDEFPKVLCGWSWEENKLFELALAVVDEQAPDRWEVVAAMVGGHKSAEDVQKHYVILLEDVKFIESGKLDHKLEESQPQPCVQVDCTHSLCWTDGDSKLIVGVLEELELSPVLFDIRSKRRIVVKNVVGYWRQLAGSIEHKLMISRVNDIAYRRKLIL